MYTVKFTSAYKKSYKLMKKRGLDLSLLDEVVDKLRQGIPLDEKTMTTNSPALLPDSVNAISGQTGC